MSVMSEEPRGERKPKVETKQQPARAQSWDFFDEEVVITGVGPFESPFVEAIANMHKTQDATMEAVREHLAALPDSTSREINHRLVMLFERHEAVVTEFFGNDDLDIDEAMHEYAAHIFILDTELFAQLRVILDDESERFDSFDCAAELEAKLWDVYERSETITDFAVSLHQGFIDSRAASIQTAITTYKTRDHGVERRDVATTKERALKIGKHIVESARTAFMIAAGVAGGMIVAQKFINRK